MLSAKTRWGTIFCCVSLPLLAGLYYLFDTIPEGRSPVLYKKILPAIGMFFSCCMLFFGQCSYSRLHSGKVFFLGYSIGLTGIVYFGLCKPLIPLSFLPSPLYGFSELLLLISLVNTILVAILPAEIKYRTARSVTLAVLTAESVLLLIIRFASHASDFLHAVLYYSVLDPAFWAGIALSFAAAVLSVWKIRQEFFLGGIIAGCVILYTAAWTSRLSPVHAELSHLLIMTALPVYLTGGLIVHGFYRMEHRISFDPLLHIYNRDYCSKIITEQAKLNVSPPFAVAMVDIDHFKKVNDTYGHQAGDAVLHAVAQAVQRGAGPQGIVCRYGGEELVLFFPQKTTADVTPVMENIRESIEKIKTRSGKKTITVTVSAGISHREHFSQSIIEVIQAADKALYAAKENGRNQVRSKKSPPK